MIKQDQFEKRVARLEEMLQTKLRVRGNTLERRIKRAGRLLPKRQRDAAKVVVDARNKLLHPHLMKQVNAAKVSSAFEALETHLNAIDPAEQRKGKMLYWAGGTVVNLLIIGALVAAIVHWKDLV